MDLRFPITLPRGDDEITVNVFAKATYQIGQPGTLSDVTGWYVEIIMAIDAAEGVEVDLCDGDIEAIEAEALACLT